MRTPLALLLCAATLSCPVTARTEGNPPPLKPLAPLVVDLTSPDCAILCSKDPTLRRAAERLAAAVEKTAKHPTKILDDTTDPASLGRGPLLVMGNLIVSAVGRNLYFTAYDFTDYSWPGKGGHVVRTIRDPFGTGAHVLMIGGSFPEDIIAATDRAVAIIAEKGPTLGYLNAVKLGPNAGAIKAYSEKSLSDKPDAWERIGGNGSWDYMLQIHKAGMGYLRTGDEAYLKPFKRELLYFFEHDVIHRPKDLGPSQIHSAIDDLLLPWDLMADHPFFAGERTEIDEKFLFLARSNEGGGPLKGAKPDLRSNHGVGRALDSFWLGRYFRRRYGLEEGSQWMAIADDYLRPQMAASKSYEDNSGHQFNVSLGDTLIYALASGREEYIRSKPLREAIQRAIIAHPIGSGPATYFSAYAIATNDPKVLSLLAYMGGDRYIAQCAGLRGAGTIGENFRAFCGFPAPATEESLLGIAVAPLDATWHERMASRTEGRQYLVTTRAEESFDKASIRDGFAPTDFYLLVDGLCGGGHSFQDANCIVTYQDHGISWLQEEYGNFGPTCSTVRQQNGVFVALDGQGPGAVHRCARLLYARKLAEGFDAVGSSLEGIGSIDWQRHLLRRKGAWTLVADRAVARKPGEAFVERNWHVRGEAVATPDGLVSSQGIWQFRLQSAGLAPGNMTGAANRKEIVRADVKAGEFVEIASLVWLQEKGKEKPYRLDQTAKGWRVSDGKDSWGVTVQTDGLHLAPTTEQPIPCRQTLPLKPPAPPVALPWARVSLGEPITAVATAPDRAAAGTRGGLVEVLGLDGAKRWEARVKSAVLSLHFLENDLLVGEDNGTISRWDATGKRLWGVTIPYETVSWAHWSEKRSCVLEITSADINGDGRQEVLLANGDARVYAFTGSGEMLWRHRVNWGVYNAMTPTTYLGKFALFGGAREPTLEGRMIVLGADGNIIAGLNCPGMESQRFRDVRLLDLNRDGKREILCTQDTANNQLLCCDEQRSPLWQADVGGSPTALAVRDVRGRPQALCASLCGYLHAFDGATGNREWVCYLGNDVRMLWPRADGTILALCPSGEALQVSAEGKLTGREGLGSPITALLRHGEHRVAPSVLPVGAEDGILRVLQR